MQEIFIRIFSILRVEEKVDELFEASFPYSPTISQLKPNT